jgi:hypothetical protein
MPFSQSWGEFQGRSETFGDFSGLAQPLRTNAATAKASTGNNFRHRAFMSVIDDQIAFGHIAQLPTGHDVGDAAFLVHSGDLHLGHQFVFAADHQDAVG